MMKVYFCDLCNESIPQADLDLGRAVRRNERLICAACEAAMTTVPAPTTAAPAPAAAHPHPTPAAARATSPPGSSAVAVALSFSVVALLAAAGSATYLLMHVDRRTGELEQRIGEEQRASFERERHLAASIESSTNESGETLRGLRGDIGAAGTRLDEAERELERTRGEAEKLTTLEARLAELDALTAAQDRQAAELANLRATVIELRGALEKGGTAPTRSEPTSSGNAAAVPTDGGSAPAWNQWVDDLQSQDSGTRWQAVQNLGKSEDVAVVPHLLPMLDDPDIFVRMAAARILGDLGAVESIPHLIDALEDEEASVREAVFVALRDLSHQNIPFDPLARDADRSKRVKAWRDWWADAGKDVLAGKKAARG